MRGGCAWTTPHVEALLSVPTERSDRQTSLKIWHKLALTQLYALVFLQSYNILSLLSPDPLQQFMEGHRKLTSLWQAQYSPSLYSQTQTDRLWRQKSSFCPRPLPKKVSFRKKCHFQRSFILTIAELCILCFPVNPQTYSSFTGVTSRVSRELRWLDEHVQMFNNSCLGISNNTVFITFICWEASLWL